MKLAFVRRGALALAFSTLLASVPAYAETAEARSAVMLRDHAVSSGKVVDRIAAGTKLTLIETSDDGSWAHVKTKGGRDGWVPIASIRTLEKADKADKPAAAKSNSGSDGNGSEDDSLAKRRDVRAESWVSKSKYHEDNDKMTVTASKAELFGRPQAGGTVVGLLRRGEVVSFVRKSPDKKWVQIDMGAGELAWVDARSVRMGADMPSSTDDDRDAQREADRDRDRNRPDPQQPKSSRRADATPAETRRNGDRDRDNDNTSPPSRDDRDRDRRDRADRDRADRDRADRDRADRDRADRDSRDSRDRDSRDRDSRDRDSRDRADRDRDRDERDREDRERDRRDREERDRRRAERDRNRGSRPAHGNNYFDAQIVVGFGKVGEQVRTNSTSATYLRNYQHLTTGLAIGAELGYARAFTEHLRLHVDFKYTIIALGSVVNTVVASDGSTSSTQLGILDQNIGGGVAIGGWWDAAGGIDLRLRLGVDAWVNQLSASNAPLAIADERILGMKVGVVFGMPAVVMAADRPLGFRLQLGALAPATRSQQAQLLTAPKNTTVGGYFGMQAFYGLIANPHKGQLHLQLSYNLDFAFSHFKGTCRPSTDDARQCRDDTVTDANIASVAHVGTIGLYYQF